MSVCCNYIGGCKCNPWHNRAGRKHRSRKSQLLNIRELFLGEGASRKRMVRYANEWNFINPEATVCAYGGLKATWTDEYGWRLLRSGGFVVREIWGIKDNRKMVELLNFCMVVEVWRLWATADGGRPREVAVRYDTLGRVGVVDIGLARGSN